MKIKHFFEDWTVKVLAVTAAVLLFLFNRVNSLEERIFTVPVELKVNEEFIPVSDYPDRVEVRLRGNSEEHLFRIQTDDIAAVVDFSSFNYEGEYRRPIDIKKYNRAAEIDPLEISIDPVDITLSLDRKITKSIDVFANIPGAPAAGFRYSQHLTSPTSVEIEGPKSILDAITFVETEEVELVGRREGFTARVRLVQPHELVTFLGGDVVEVRVVIIEEELSILKEDISFVITGLDDSLDVVSPIPDFFLQFRVTQSVFEATDFSEYAFLLDFTGITEPGVYTISPVLDTPEDSLLILDFGPEAIELKVDYIENEERE